MGQTASIDELLKERIVKSLCKEFSGEITETYVKDIKCIRCGKKEAFCYIERPFRIKCNRRNNCGLDVPYTDYFPNMLKELYEEQKVQNRHDPHYAQRFYAVVIRGIANYEKWGGRYEHAVIKGQNYPALSFLLSDGATKNMRLIKGPRNHHNTGDTKGLLWLPRVELDLTKEIVVAESPLKAMALLEFGKQAISCVSTTTKPEDSIWLSEHKTSLKKLVLAFDNDPAGREATRKWAKYCRTHKLTYEIVLPIEGDWDSLWKDGRLDEKTWAKCQLEGALFAAKSPSEAATAYYERLGHVPNIFEWQGVTCRPDWTKDKETGEPFLEGASEIIKGTLKASFSIKREGLAIIEECRPIENFLVLQTPDGKETRTLATAKNLCNRNAFHEFLIERARLNFSGSCQDLASLLNEHIDYQSQCLVRQIERFGYERQTNAFVFKQLAVDSFGNVIKPNKHGYFEGLNIMPPLNYNKEAIEGEFPPLDIPQFMEDLWQSFGSKGWLSLGYYVATYFSHIHFEELGYHPFLSIFGPRGSGKSSLATKLNEAFTFIREEGIAFSRANTIKGYARVLAERNGLPICMLEGNDERRMNLTSEDLLALYNRNASQTTAQRTMDNTTRKLPFDAGLVMVQMQEPFSSAGAKQRFISIKFPEKNNVFNEEESQAYKRFMANHCCDLGVQILKSRKYFEGNWLKEIDSQVQTLRESGINQARVLGNHAILLAGLTSFLTRFCPDGDDHYKDCLEFMVQCARAKAIESLTDDNTLAESFFDAFEALSDGEYSPLKKGRHFIEDKDTIYIRLTEVLAVMSSNYYIVGKDQTRLEDALRVHPRFLYRKKKRSHTLWISGERCFNCWWFRKEGNGGAEVRSISVVEAIS